MSAKKLERFKSRESEDDRKHDESTSVRDPMAKWYDVVWLRKQRLDYSIPDTIEHPILFSPHLVPAVSHPLIVERGTEFAEELLTHRFYSYADFTSLLERDAINVVTKDLARRVFWAELPWFMYRGAGRIYTDEAGHAQEADEIVLSVIDQTGVATAHLHKPRFLSNLEFLCANLDPARRRLATIGFAIVSETLISSILVDIPTDPLVVSCVRDFVREHAKDEGRHHAYFSALLKIGWPRLPKQDQEFLGPLLPSFFNWFLEPDLQWLRSFLAASHFDRDGVERVVAESYPPAVIAEQIRSAAKHSLARFADAGVFESQQIKEAFAKGGLCL
jgi:hypothetical protein